MSHPTFSQISHLMHFFCLHRQVGFREGVEYQTAQHASAVRKLQQRAEEEIKEAYERGREEMARGRDAQLQRDQAERVLLVHQIDEARQRGDATQAPEQMA